MNSQLDMQECATFPRIFDEGSGTWYTPFYSWALGTVGYMAERVVPDSRNPPALVPQQTAIYLNPSFNETPDDACVFVYIGEAGVPWEDGAVHHYLIWEDEAMTTDQPTNDRTTCAHCDHGIWWDVGDRVWRHEGHEGETCGEQSPDTIATPRR